MLQFFLLPRSVLLGVVQEWSLLPFHTWHLGQARGDGEGGRGQRGGGGGDEQGGAVQVFRARLAIATASSSSVRFLECARACSAAKDFLYVINTSYISGVYEIRTRLSELRASFVGSDWVLMF